MRTKSEEEELALGKKKVEVKRRYLLPVVETSRAIENGVERNMT